MGGILAGITPVWASEIEPFPVLVTHKRLPSMKHYADVYGLKGSGLEPVDLTSHEWTVLQSIISIQFLYIRKKQLCNIFSAEKVRNSIILSS